MDTDLAIELNKPFKGACTVRIDSKSIILPKERLIGFISNYRGIEFRRIIVELIINR